ncbi:putative S-adenosylmethionine:tRNA ribosyltransferase-isomerase [Corallococcus coralloides]|uniref:Putative S-adenosylmethionine:tRNA ribosyltransferase-isomerase n=1 Tax=Corallococcus coralloides TaxID=184914 RepID=A0A410S1M3_CORCK|nr:putative S-adenosylmethionine:tRNA ribosyltransferase-isomerase [Corallococcus coralloides]
MNAARWPREHPDTARLLHAGYPGHEFGDTCLILDS